MTDTVLVNREDLVRVLNYCMDDEENDYRECLESGVAEEALEDHIYMYLKRLEDCVNDQG